MDSTLNVREELKKAILLSAGMFLVGKKKLGELVSNLQANGLNREEAEKTAHEVIATAKQHKDEFIQKISDEVEKRNMFATKEDVAKLQKTLHEISKKLEE